MLDPPRSTPALWSRIHQLVARSRESNFYPIALGRPEVSQRDGVLTSRGKRCEANKQLTAWCRKTRDHFGPFGQTTYAGLSHRLLKFYQELQDIAENIATATSRRVWQYGYILIVRTNFAF